MLFKLLKLVKEIGLSYQYQKTSKQAGAELGQAQPQLGLRLTNA